MVKLSIGLLGIILLAAITSCSCDSSKKNWMVGDIDGLDRIVIYLINGRTPIPLQTEYGVMLVNDGGAGDPRDDAFERQPPKPRYVIAIRAKRKVIDTTDIAKFKRTIMEIPKGSKLVRYDSCTVSRASHLNEQVWKEFEDTIRSAGLVLPEAPLITCYCTDER